VQVWHDFMGLFTDFVPRHAKRYAGLAEIMTAALQEYMAEVRAGTFPTMEHSSSMDAGELQAALRQPGNPEAGTRKSAEGQQ